MILVGPVRPDYVERILPVLSASPATQAPLSQRPARGDVSDLHWGPLEQLELQAASHAAEQLRAHHNAERPGTRQVAGTTIPPDVSIAIHQLCVHLLP